MTEREFETLMQLMDSMWGQATESYEAGFRLLLKDRDAADVQKAISRLIDKGGEWMPKPPVLHREVRRVVSEREMGERINARLEREERAELEAARPAGVRPALPPFRPDRKLIGYIEEGLKKKAGP